MKNGRAVSAALLALTLAAAGPASAQYAIVVKDIENPYMIRMYEGFKKACDELGVEAVWTGPGKDGMPDQAECVLALLEQGVDAIAVAANDQAALADALSKAIDAGAPIVSLDSMVDPQRRIVHIQQASPEVIGRALIQAGASMIGGEGQFAILSTTPAMPNQASWVRWMEYELGAYPEKYSGMELVSVSYGLDEYGASAARAEGLLEGYPDLKLIIAPTVVGIRAAAEVVKAAGSRVLVTGLGLPSEMADYIIDGACPWMYLWNPSSVGYLAAYTIDALASGSCTGALGEVVSAGTLGVKAVTESEDGGTEIVLGNPQMYDKTNIMVWKGLF
ncbi:MAG: substrate-binding domain-containing protein [Oscillospiraceae bacterium]|jgi:rhamnose transport system substrate-binding protein|nr:substrate-binding domain-containing protein [Oscillospiraceae bacterium]